MVKRAVRVSDRQIVISRGQLEGLGGQIYGQEGRGSEKSIGGSRGKLEGVRSSIRIWRLARGSGGPAGGS